MQLHHRLHLIISGDLKSVIPRKNDIFLGRSTLPITPKHSQIIKWCDNFISVTPENSRGINCVILMGPMAPRGSYNNMALRRSLKGVHRCASYRLLERVLQGGFRQWKGYSQKGLYQQEASPKSGKILLTKHTIGAKMITCRKIVLSNY